MTAIPQPDPSPREFEPPSVDLADIFEHPEEVLRELDEIEAKDARGEMVWHTHEEVHQRLGLDQPPNE